MAYGWFPTQTYGIVSTSSSRRVFGFFYTQLTNESFWTENINAIAKHKTNLTAISLSPYTISSNGALIYYNVTNGSLQEHYMNTFSNMGLETYPIINGKTGGINGLRELMFNTTKTQQFINDAITKAKKYNFTGYNLDIEIVSNVSSDGVGFIDFVNTFSDSLHANNMKLSSDFAKCICGYYYMNVSCAQYKSSKIDHVMSMRTYKDNTLEDWHTDVTQNIQGLGNPKYTSGVSSKKGLYWLNYTNMDWLKQQNVETIGLWTIPKVGETNDTYTQTLWNAMGYWLI
eukprot:388412_1